MLLTPDGFGLENETVFFHAVRRNCRIADPGGRRTLWSPLGGHSFFRDEPLQPCFVDEAGDLGALCNPPQANVQPVPVVGGFLIDSAKLPILTDNVICLKHEHFPDLPYRSGSHLAIILPKIKGLMFAET